MVLRSLSVLRQEAEWKNVVGQLSAEIESKMDRVEFGPFRDELEERLQDLASQLQASLQQRVNDQTMTEDDAAGQLSHIVSYLPLQLHIIIIFQHL